MAQLMPLPLTVSYFSEIQVGFTFLVLAHPGSLGQRAVKRVCVCVIYCWYLLNSTTEKLTEHWTVMFVVAELPNRQCKTVINLYTEQHLKVSYVRKNVCIKFVLWMFGHEINVLYISVYSWAFELPSAYNWSWEWLYTRCHKQTIMIEICQLTVEIIFKCRLLQPFC